MDTPENGGTRRVYWVSRLKTEVAESQKAASDKSGRSMALTCAMQHSMTSGLDLFKHGLLY